MNRPRVARRQLKTLWNLAIINLLYALMLLFPIEMINVLLGVLCSRIVPWFMHGLLGEAHVPSVSKQKRRRSSST